jgi:hypothetical protein
VSFPWEKWDKRLRALAAEGLSASEIADRLCRESRLSLSRNGVIGRAHRKRIALTRGAGPRKRAERAAAVQAPTMVKKFTPAKAPLLPRARQSQPVAPTPVPVERDVARHSILTLGETCCRWIVGDPRTPFEAIYCGGRTIDELPYCGAHARKAYG